MFALLGPNGAGKTPTVERMIDQEPDHLAPHLQVGDVGVQVQAVDALDLQGHVPVQHVVDVHHVGHATSLVARRPALPARPTSPLRRSSGRGPGGGDSLPPPTEEGREVRAGKGEGVRGVLLHHP
ncbi:MAG: hypothetical protein ACR2LJ_08745, partial [Acidimicrobiales bacterium]